MSGWVAGAVVVGGLASAAIGSDAARSASNAQARSAANAQQISQDQFSTIQQQNAPFTQSGYGALSALDWGLGIAPQTATGGAPSPQPGTPWNQPGSMNSLYGPNGGAFAGLTGTQLPPRTGPPGPAGSTAAQPSGQTGGQTGGLGFGSLTTPFTTANWQQLSPAYNFQKQQGEQGVLNADAAGAGALSGSAQKDLIDYNQSAANTSFNNAFNQYQTQQGNIFSRLSGIAGLGQSSANNTGQQGTTLAGQAAQSATNIGTAQAGGIVGSANAWSGGISNAAPWLSSFAGGGNNNARNWDTENPSNFQDFQSSDRRLKTDIHLVGKLVSGLNVYTFRYSEAPSVVHMGVMADEVEKVIPQAVSTDEGGYLRVSYGMLR